MKYIKIFFILIIFLVSFLANKTLAQEEATFLLSPRSGNYNQGDVFSLELKFNSSEPVTSIKSYLNFNPSTIRVESVDSNAGIFPYWWENIFNNEEGTIQLQASLPAPGEKEGLIAKIKFQVIKSGQANITFDASSLALKPSDENILNLTASVGAQFSLFSPSLATMIKSNVLVSVLSGILLILVIFFLILQKKRLVKKA